MKFFAALSKKSRTLLSISGIDPEGIYHSFREGWKDNLCICLYQDDEIIGVGKLSDFPNNGVYLSCLVIADKLQHKGFGTRLVKYLMACAIMNGAQKMALEVRKDNPKAQNCFQRLGFRVIKDTSLCYLMEKRL